MENEKLTKHTPGPWFACGDGSCGTLVRAGDIRTGRKVASTWVNTSPMSIPENEANARLIAASPDLLAALKRMVSQCERYLNERPVSESDMLNPDYVSPMEQSLAAIAKAEGRFTATSPHLK